MVLDVMLSATGDEDETDSRYSVPSSRPCIVNATEHTYNNSLPMPDERYVTHTKDVQPMTTENGLWNNGAHYKALLEKNHHYVNGLHLRQAAQQQQQLYEMCNTNATPMVQHNLTYMDRRPSMAIMNKCYEFDFGFQLPKMMTTSICDKQVGEDYI